ncbi:bifunctional diaminohydroxyphosphoribosylaminopyrimidine deaminase/5-amino-6-(5-phosphoribosylamino)uracil reductase RibD [Sphingomonas changnyeongensis]|uniref:Riboflavin biosynthesis protein RibD n=1 Tax=Sphingomonas changnyeongensis TaxID=2698679 RepID=A0A7Z2S9J8_9SPHN|nr:bifunctional diaminohydroxyphosphoribosylaminopyrimidine deaminase/5-amino-6-(5-phosphoribosylamino)uracil reductase RibD [Sphingomonas changnyeongensis]QHL91842.1 bifunctional diaminohydroxyphosphoribosylaminopyrimidine deaminase/5-amino-6-(5-phosphoribosylamino)uracil reductase RibD [Sphingomonas changnyeongensis]
MAPGGADARWLDAALALAMRGQGRTWPNPNVGCVIVKDGCVIGRGWTRPGGRPHAEAVALMQAGEAARGATAYVTLEPCAHDSARGPACADLLAAAGVARVVSALTDPDPRTAGRGHDRLRAAGIAVDVCAAEAGGAAGARRAMAGWLTRQQHGRPRVTLKLGLSLDGCIALANGESRWITGPEARAHAHLERSRHEAILVGRGTWDADRPRLDVRLPGLERFAPARIVMSARGAVDRLGPDDRVIAAPDAIAGLPCDNLLVEGGAGTAAAFLAADLVDRLVIYRAPLLIGGGRGAVGGFGLADLAAAHGRWALQDTRMLGTDRLDIYERRR